MHFSDLLVESMHLYSNVILQGMYFPFADVRILDVICAFIFVSTVNHSGMKCISL